MAEYNRITERQPHDYEIVNPTDFLLDYRYTLVNVIEVEQAICWLMTNNVLDKTDSEMILCGYKTSVLKAGDLIDTVLRRGPRGFNVLMEFIEYEYPEIYTKIMEKPARDPDPKVYVPTQRRSTHLSQSFKCGIELIFKALENTKTAKDQAQRSIKQLQERIDDIENELDMKHQQILELSEKVLELGNHNKELSEQKQQAQKERTEAVLQQEKLRRERDQYRDKGQERLMANICSAIKQYSKETGHPKISSKIYEEKSSDKDESKPVAHDDELNKLKTMVRQLENKNEELLRDNRCLEEQLEKLAEQYDLFESSIFGYKEEVKCLKGERDQALHHFEELKKNYQTLQQENSDLKKTIMTDQSKLRVLKNENSAGRSRFRKCRLSTSQNMDCPDPNKKLQELEDKFVSFYGHDSEDDRTGAS